MAGTTSAAPGTKRRDRTHWLYLAVIAAVVLGIAVGLLFPAFGVELKWLGTAFVGLIKLMIAPVIFCTIVLGIGSIRSAAKVGRVGGLALGYFLVDVHGGAGHRAGGGQPAAPGRGSAPHRGTARPGLRARRHGRSGGTTDFLLSLIPVTLLSALTSGAVLQALLVALLVGFAIQGMGRSGEPLLRGIGHLQKLVFRILGMIMWAAPIGAFGAMAAVVGATGVDALEEPRRPDARLLRRVRAVRRSSSSAGCSARSPASTCSPCCATWAASSC